MKLLAAAFMPLVLAAPSALVPTELPTPARATLLASLDAASRHERHVWRDTPPRTPQGLVNGYIEIARGDRRKWEFNMRTNVRAVDRVMPPQVGGYPINYGYVPQTVSYDGDPFDVLVLGPPLPGGQIVRGVVVGVMVMEDEKGLDSKVVLSPVDSAGKPTFQLTEADRQRVGDFFKRYKRHETGKFSRVPGWGTVGDGEQLIAVTHAFFLECRQKVNAPCRVHAPDTTR